MDERLRAALVAIATHEPYPVEVWTPLTEAEEDAIGLALDRSGVRFARDRTYAAWGRHIGARYREMAREALDAG